MENTTKDRGLKRYKRNPSKETILSLLLTRSLSTGEWINVAKWERQLRPKKREDGDLKKNMRKPRTSQMEAGVGSKNKMTKNKSIKVKDAEVAKTVLIRPGKAC